MKFFCNLLLYLSIYLYLLGSYSHAQGNDPSGNLQVTSKTDLKSADCHNGKINEESDKERTTIGIGETVTLTLTGKGINEDSKVEWKLEGQGATLQADGSSANLTAKTVMKDSTCSVTASFNGCSSESLTFNIYKPNNLLGKEVGIARIPPDTIGIAGVIRVTVHPTNVSFENLSTIEKDEGSELDSGSQLYLVPIHHPDPKPKPIKSSNIFGDLVVLTRPKPDKAPLPGTIKYRWFCDWYVSGISPCIKQVIQEFEMTHQHSPLSLPPIESDVRASVSKFEAFFENSYRIMYFEHEPKLFKSSRK